MHGLYPCSSGHTVAEYSDCMDLRQIGIEIIHWQWHSKTPHRREQKKTQDSWCQWQLLLPSVLCSGQTSIRIFHDLPGTWYCIWMRDNQSCIWPIINYHFAILSQTLLPVPLFLARRVNALRLWHHLTSFLNAWHMSWKLMDWASSVSSTCK